MKVYEGSLIAKELKFCLVVSRFNEFLSNRLMEGALDCLKRHGAEEKNVEIVWVPGSFEMPLITLKMARSKKYDGIVCLGVIIRGDTPHFEYIASEVAKGLAKVNFETGIPVSFGIITAETIEQAIERAGTKSGNKGWQAALSTIEMANLLKELS